jgi:hypothetical protein
VWSFSKWVPQNMLRIGWPRFGLFWLKSVRGLRISCGSTKVFQCIQGSATIKRLKNTGLVPKKILSAEHLFQALLGQSVRSEV